MAQEYNAILPSGSTNILQDNIDSRKNDEALRSGFSGPAFPTSPAPVAGQRCYREDLKKEYIFNGEGWVEVASSGAIAQEVTLARGTHTELQDRLSVSINPDGTLKTPATANVDEFKVSGLEPTYVSTNSFSVPGDVRAIFTENRRLKITQGTETIYPAVVSASYDDVTDKTTIVIDNITITNEITAVDYSLVQYGLPANLQEVSEKNQPGGYAGLDAEGLLPSAKLNSDVYKMGNILGTVSQLEGVPTGAIIERGSNDNGWYVRFSDGTQICGAVLRQSPPGNSSLQSVWTFPAEFYLPPGNFDTSQIIISAALGGASEVATQTGKVGLLISSGDSVTSTYCKVYHYNGYATAPIAIVALMTAIGRWY